MAAPSQVNSVSQSQSYFTTGVYRQSVRLVAEPLETHGQNSFPQLNICSRSPYKTLSDEMMDLSFTIAAGPRQRSNFQIRV
jgi:hypothetical protein